MKEREGERHHTQKKKAKNINEVVVDAFLVNAYVNVIICSYFSLVFA